MPLTIGHPDHHDGHPDHHDAIPIITVVILSSAMATAGTSAGVVTETTTKTTSGDQR